MAARQRDHLGGQTGFEERGGVVVPQVRDHHESFEQRKRDDGIEQARRQTDLKIRDIQNFYKALAVFLPPIPPLLVGLIVFVSRRLREREPLRLRRCVTSSSR